MLKNIMKKYNCDKIEHMYYEVYENDFQHLQKDEIKILEIGIWKGTSHSSWAEYFPNAQIYGIDIFTRISPEEVPILKNDRMHWIKGDSTSEEVKQRIEEKWGNVKFDIIIDDGLHTPEANAKTFLNLIDRLKSDGTFYIEDVWPLDIMTEQEWNHRWIKSRPEKYNKKSWDIFAKSIENYKVETVDLRQSSHMPDSYIVKVKK